MFQENKAHQIIFRKTNISYPLIRTRTCAYQGSEVKVKKYLFFGKFGVLCFLETPVLKLALLPYYRQNKITRFILKFKKVYKVIENNDFVY